MVVNPTTLSNPFGGTTEIRAFQWGDDDVIMLGVSNLPQSACVRLISGRASSTTGNQSVATTIVSTGQTFYAVIDPEDRMAGLLSWIVNPTQAGTSCKYTSVWHSAVGINGTPRFGRLTGEVEVWMAFIVDA
jgi:hypothetical protein